MDAHNTVCPVEYPYDVGVVYFDLVMLLDLMDPLNSSSWTKCPPFHRRCILIKISLKFVPWGLIDNNPSLI